MSTVKLVMMGGGVRSLKLKVFQTNVFAHRMGLSPIILWLSLVILIFSSADVNRSRWNLCPCTNTCCWMYWNALGFPGSSYPSHLELLHQVSVSTQIAKEPVSNYGHLQTTQISMEQHDIRAHMSRSCVRENRTKVFR